MKALIFGANGQDGHYLVASCRQKGYDVIAVSRNGDCLHGDVADYVCVEQFIKKHQPDLIFHLAARSSTSHEAIFENHETIGSGTINILESVKKWSPGSKVFITGSGLQFENRLQPISERDPFAYSNPYVTVRNYSVGLARYYRSLGIKTYVGYLFHHESPLRGERHVSQKIARAVRSIADGNHGKIVIGDLSVKKEWTFAGDVVEGILLLVNQDSVFEATIGSGIGYTIADWLAECFKAIDRDWRDFVVEELGYRPEYNVLISDPTTINSLGWHPETSFSQLADIMMHRQK